MKPLDERQRAAAEGLIREEWPKLERFFRTKVPPADILELAQSTCLTYVQRLDEVETNPRAYLWAIARFQVLKHWDRFRARDAAAFDSSQHSLAAVGPSLSSAIARRSSVVAALQSLPADQQMAIELRHGEGLTLEETAHALGVSLATAKRYLAAAEDSLRTLLGPQAEATIEEYRRT